MHLIMVTGHALFGAGAAPLWPLGVSYIDDHVVLRKVPIYLGKKKYLFEIYLKINF